MINRMKRVKNNTIINNLIDKSRWARRETLLIHKIAPETRIASSLSCVEIFTVLFYGGVLSFNPKNRFDHRRDRFVISKGHGSVCFYPILADVGYIDKKHLQNVCKNGALLGSIPDFNIPGYETINGSLGHGLGVGCGIAIALKRKKSPVNVFVLIGDGELFEGAVWEAIMFAGHHKLDNMVLIIDKNDRSMLGDCRNIINLEPLDKKLKEFGWETTTVDGHDVKKIYEALRAAITSTHKKPRVIIAETVKGKGVPCLENDVLCHVKNVSPEMIDMLAGVLP
jgi:transketolase